MARTARVIHAIALPPASEGEMQYKDYYAALGVARDASEQQIKQAYRKLARKYHPDVSKEADAEARFKEVAEAYQTLKDPQKRAAYDQLGSHRPGEEFRPPPNWQEQWQGSSAEVSSFAEQMDLSDLFAHLGAGFARGASARANRSMPGRDFEVPVAISIEQAYAGTQIDLDLAMPEYDERGRLRQVPQSFRARIPKGATEGQRLRLAGKGGRGFNGGRNGDLYLDISLRPHPIYRAAGHDLFLDLPLAPWEAVLGTSVEVPTPGGAVRLKVPAGTQAAQQLRLPRRGLPRPHGEPGDLYAIVSIVVPREVSDRERALYRELSEVGNFDPRAALRQEDS